MNYLLIFIGESFRGRDFRLRTSAPKIDCWGFFGSTFEPDHHYLLCEYAWLFTLWQYCTRIYFNTNWKETCLRGLLPVEIPSILLETIGILPVARLVTIKVRKRAKIRNRYSQAPHLTQDTKGKVTTSQLDITNESQEVSPFPAGDHKASTNRRAWKHNKTRQKKHKRSTKEAPPWNGQ